MEKHILRPLVVTTYTDRWFQKDHPAIEQALSKMKNVEIEYITTTTIDITKTGLPALKGGGAFNPDGWRISESWFKEHITSLTQGEFNMVFFVFSHEERRAWGLPSKFNGKYYPNTDDVYECYVIVDKYDHAEFKRIMVHEALHGAVRFSGQLDELNKKCKVPYTHYGREIDDVVHHYDYVLNDLNALCSIVDFNRWGALSTLVGLYTKLVSLLKQKKDMEKISTSAPITPKKVSRLIDFAKAIEVFEDYVRPGEKYRDGTIAQYGSKSYRNCNPGNLRWSPFMKPQTEGGFAVFDTYEDGFKALVYQLQIAVDGRSRVYKPSMTLLEFFNVYAPSGDNNFPKVYAEFVAKRMGITVDTIISTLA